MSDAEFDAITAGTIHLGDNTTGPVNVTAALTRATATNVTLNSATTVNFTTGTLDTAGGNVTLNPGTTFSPANSGVEITTGTGSVGFGAGDDLRLVMAGLAVDSQYQQLNVAGKVDRPKGELLAEAADRLRNLQRGIGGQGSVQYRSPYSIRSTGRAANGSLRLSRHVLCTSQD